MSSLPIYDVKAHRTELLASPHYLARPGFTTSVAWREEKGGHALYSYDGKPVNPDLPSAPYGYIANVGYILPNKFFVGATGAWSPKYGASITAAKASFLLGCPDNIPELAKDWEAATTAARTIQTSVGSGGTPANWLATENGKTTFRLTKKIFEKKGGDSPSDMKTADWPVAPEYQEHLLAIADTHDVVLLPVYDIDESLVPQADIERKLRGALVEVTSKITHYAITKGATVTDSFTADIQQIIILKYGQAPPPTVFKRTLRPVKFGSVAFVAQDKATTPIPVKIPTPNTVIPAGTGVLNNGAAGFGKEATELVGAEKRKGGPSEDGEPANKKAKVA
ncbi:hypothetical protein DFH06DRAFT_1337607 [Mycena polygramma]|nr:hypothetical protein DFH06DRAFT_1337607 [Mycena polygramma]